MARIRTRTTAVATVLALAVGIPPALAQPAPCSADFADVDGLLSPDEADLALEATADLDASDELFLRTRVIATAGADGLDAWAGDALGDCPSWQAADGNARGDLLLLVVAVEDRTIGSYFGIDLVVDLEPERERVHDAMATLLDRDAVGRAIALGVNLYGEALATSPATTPAAPTDEEPADEGGGTNALPFVLGGLGVVGGGVAGAIALRRRRRTRERVARAQQARTAAMNAYYDLEQRWEQLDASVTVLLGATHPDDGVAATMVAEADEAEAALAAVRDRLLALPEPASFAEGRDVDAGIAGWDEVVAEVERVRTEIDEVEGAVQALQDAREQAPGMVERAGTDLEAARSAVAEVEGQGFRAAGAARWLDDAQRALDGAHRAVGDGRFGDAVAAATTASQRCAQALERAQAIPRLAADLPGRIDELARGAADAERAADEVATVLTGMQRRWQRTVWDDLSDADDHVRELARAAAGAASDARDHLEDQDWDATLRLLDEGDEDLAEAVELAAAPAARDREAEQQLATARTRYQELDARAREAEALLGATEAAVAPHRSALAAAARQAQKGRELLGDRPDPIRAVRLADEAEAALASAIEATRRTIADFERDQQEVERLVASGRQHLREARRLAPRGMYQRDVDRADDALDDAEREARTDPAAARRRAQRGVDLARDVIRRKRRRRDADRDAWRSTATSVSRSTRSGSTRTSPSRSRGGFGGGGASRGRAGRGSSGSSPFGGGGSTRH